MLKETLMLLFERDLNKVINELNLYKDELNIWRIKNGITNPAGNLALHLIGNLSTYIGKEIGNTNYVRNRPLEFSEKNIPRQVIIGQLKETIEVVKHALAKLNAEDLENEFPVLVFEKPTTTTYLLVHLTTHLAYHLGQINYHRRLLEG